jgi:hypothetical protein
MKNFALATTAAAALSAAFLGLAAPALAAPSGGDAQATIAELESQGNRVIVHKLSDSPLADASVVGVNRGPAIRGTVMDDFNDRTYQNTITGYVYYVNVKSAERTIRQKSAERTIRQKSAERTIRATSHKEVALFL